MKIEIFDVGHGACAMLTADNGKVALFDCGHDDDIGFRPSDHLIENGITSVELLAISHFDHDHLSDLPRLQQKVWIRGMLRGGQCTPSQLLMLKQGPPSEAVRSAVNMHASYTGALLPPPDFGDVQIDSRCNHFPAFRDSNNLSLVIFLHYHDLSICLPGDLECAGWEKLLTDWTFLQNLRRVNVFIPSHHGRDNGYCPAVFDYCKPAIIIVSDTEIQYDTQKDLYRKHATGIKTSSGEWRYVFTTRCDGNIRLEKNATEPFTLTWGWKTKRTAPPSLGLAQLLTANIPKTLPGLGAPGEVSPFGLTNLFDPPPGPVRPLNPPSSAFSVTPPEGLDFLTQLGYFKPKK